MRITKKRLARMAEDAFKNNLPHVIELVKEVSWMRAKFEPPDMTDYECICGASGERPSILKIAYCTVCGKIMTKVSDR